MKKSILAVILLAICTFTYAKEVTVPAPPYPIVITNPDGTKLTIRIIGDERGHKIYTLDGFQIQQNENEFYYYLTQTKNGDTKVSKIKAKNEDERSKKDLNFLKKKGIKRDIPKNN
ncbi:MAG: hypothetical protein Q4D14_01775 [Bacteroidales bacterium]|nr:hypothetical protein [Bacteroidales bacterium]